MHDESALNLKQAVFYFRRSNVKITVMTPNAPKDPFSRLITIVLLLVGVVFSLSGIGLIVREFSFGKVALPAVGSIVEVNVTQNTDGPMYTPIVEFQTLTGDSSRFAGLSTSPPPVKGTIVPVLYHPADPKNARIDTFVDRWLFPSVFLALGATLFGAGIGLGRLSGKTVGSPNVDEANLWGSQNRN